ncbi:MAG: bile acid:sodium symporter family protein [Algoriphagus sp.]|uniref:bile acid:sodium symporter family protein n=1 Tax=Algoriphagus sp. TaxID=1872435 RepID=UPI002629BC5F|nr:bile acid:sodium symporter family protein [Algoriphagus sp.]MDG1276623.1 bile acid:sodium symporter family protein [Algoriphagus sp.]
MEANVLTQVFLPLSLAIIMFGMGLSLTLADFKRILIYPKAVTIGLVNQMILLPLIAFGLCKLFDLSPELSVGMMILAACPGGATSNLIAHLAKGDTALSVTLTAFSSIITVFTIPIIVNFAILHFIPNGSEQQLDVLNTVISVLAITIIPVIIGMVLLQKSPDLAKKMDQPLRKLSALFFVLIILAAILKERAHVVEYFVQAGPVAISLNIITLALGFYMAKAFGVNEKQSRTISIESGIQNGTLGITIAATLIGNSVMPIPSVIYGLLMFGTAGALIYWGNRKKVVLEGE